MIVRIISDYDSKRVQEACFEKGKSWPSGEKTCKDIQRIWSIAGAYYLIVEDLIIHYGGREENEAFVGTRNDDLDTYKNCKIYNVDEFLSNLD